MSRIPPVQVSDATPSTRTLLEGVQRELGMVPNQFKCLARSPAALLAYLNLGKSLAAASTPILREQIALAVAGATGSDYAASLHTALGAKANITPEELAANLRGESETPRVRAALQFVVAIIRERGRVSDAELRAVRAAGYADSQITEIVALVAHGLFATYFNHVAATTIDFPVVDTSGLDG